MGRQVRIGQLFVPQVDISYREILQRAPPAVGVRSTYGWERNMLEFIEELHKLRAAQSLNYLHGVPVLASIYYNPPAPWQRQRVKFSLSAPRDED